MDMASLITDLSTLFTAMIKAMADVIAWVVAQPVLLIFVILCLIGVVVSLVKKWMPGL